MIKIFCIVYGVMLGINVVNSSIKLGVGVVGVSE